MPNTSVRAAAEGMPKFIPTTAHNTNHKRSTTLLPHEFPPEYAMICEGNCLEPIYPDGTRLMFSRVERYQPGDFVILIFKPEYVPAGEHQMLVKKLVLSPGPAFWQPNWINRSGIKPTVLVEMLNPHRLIAIDPTRLLGIHKCLGTVPAHRISGRVLTDDEVRASYPSASMGEHVVSSSQERDEGIPEETPTIGDACDLICRAKSVVEMINMAAESSSITGDARNAISWTCIHAQELLEKAAQILEDAIEGGAEGGAK